MTLDAITEQIEAWLWNPAFNRLPKPSLFLLKTVRLIYALLRDAILSTLTLRAMGLVYVTILSMVPLLALVFSVLKGFGFHKQLEPLLYNLLSPLGEKGVELTDQVMGFVDNIKGGMLAGVGLAVLIYTSISMIKKVEDSFNYVFRVETARSFLQRFSEYLSVLMIGPVLMVVAMGTIAYVGKLSIVEDAATYEVINETILLIGKIVPYALITGLFTFAYMFIPNARINFWAALGGGITGGVLWATAGLAFTEFVVNSTRNVTIYASFAIVIIALIWLYVSWLILLIGAQTTFYLQKPEYIRIGYTQLNVSNRLREKIALALMLEVAKAFRDGAKPVTIEDIAKQVDLPGLVIGPVLRRLIRANLVMYTGKDGLTPARDPQQISMAEVLGAVRNTQHGDIFPKGNWPLHVDAIDRETNNILVEANDERSLYDILDSDLENNHELPPEITQG